MKKFTKGFTLIELLVVIAIIGILSSVVLASLNSARQKARDARRISDIGQVKLALELWADSNSGTYPVTTYAGLEDELVDGDYIGSMPVDPFGTSTPYLYASLDSGTSYELCAELENPSNPVLGPGNSTTTEGIYCVRP